LKSRFAYHDLDGLPSTALLKFKDPIEQEATVGPLFAAAAKANAPVFGPDDFSSVEATQKLTAAIKKAIHSKDNPVIDLLAPADPAMPPSSEDNFLSEKVSKLSIQPKTDKDRPDDLESSGIVNSRKFHSSRELHDQSHYSTRGLAPETNSMGELIDNIMLRRALNGYLFDCKKNWGLVAGDQWLQEVWEWIAGKFPELVTIRPLTQSLGAEDAAKDNRMVSGSLDLSYIGVYTVWMNLLGEYVPLDC
jgi:WD repeat-containing protein mio